jgi:hypothetical protein
MTEGLVKKQANKKPRSCGVFYCLNPRINYLYPDRSKYYTTYDSRRHFVPSRLSSKTTPSDLSSSRTASAPA